MTVAWDIPSNGHPTSKLCFPLRRGRRRGRAHHADSSQPGQGQFHNNPLSMCKYRDYPSERRCENAARVGKKKVTASFVDQYRREEDIWMMGRVGTETVHLVIPYCFCPASTDLVYIRGIDFAMSRPGHPRCRLVHLLVRPSWSLSSHKHLYSSSTSEPSPAARKAIITSSSFFPPIVPRMRSPLPNLITRRRAHAKPLLPPTRWVHHGCRRRAI
ncbi:uncharacterized protein LY79DRAFT_44743 [Colletotrichum navitas]|uniref:Uncharacterized protein n=1 Tax=Colletotrichum navitas TaxID=681940 RepID=A0AAD8PMG2_9PEZI|nr:uncharacterized protein LY79DRAFT_44743 [Colletotrichum navitas]KAK1572673.1 hypothetical protein LY79DRAFT_44743 [Colletotrichum navitas]